MIRCPSWHEAFNQWGLNAQSFRTGHGCMWQWLICPLCHFLRGNSTHLTSQRSLPILSLPTCKLTSRILLEDGEAIPRFQHGRVKPVGRSSAQAAAPPCPLPCPTWVCPMFSQILHPSYLSSQSICIIWAILVQMLEKKSILFLWFQSRQSRIFL